MKIISDPESVAVLWKKVVVPVELYDEFEIRKAFFDASLHDWHVMVDDIKSPAVMLSLQREIGSSKLRFVSSPFLERNRGFYQEGSEDRLLELYAQATEQSELDDICELDPITKTSACIPSDPAYILDTVKNSISSSEDLIRFLPKNIRQNIQKLQKLKDAKKIEVKITDIETTLISLKALTYERFGEDSWLQQEHIYNGFVSLEKLRTENPTSIHCFEITDGEVTIAASIAVLYLDRYYILMAASTDTQTYSGIGSFLYFENILMGLSMGGTRIDAAIGDCGWKERWGFEKVPQYQFVKKGV